jgi:hypothetical protein
MRMTHSIEKKSMMLVMAFVFIVLTPSWGIHIRAGQIYILYAFLLAVAFFLTQTSLRLKDILSGMILGVTIWLRPPMLMMAVPFIINRKKEIIAGMMLSMALYAVSILMMGQLPLWENYHQAMREWGKSQICGSSPITSTVCYPPLYIEGEDIQPLMRSVLPSGWPNFSVQGILVDYFDMGLTPNTLLLLFAVTAVMMLFYLNRALLSSSYSRMFLVGFLLVMLFEYFIPAPRFGYNYVQWIFPILLISRFYEKLDTRVLIFICTGLFLCLNDRYWILGESVLFASVLQLLKHQDIVE